MRHFEKKILIKDLNSCLKLKLIHWVLILCCVNCFIKASNPYDRLRFKHHEFILNSEISDEVKFSNFTKTKKLSKDSSYYYQINHASKFSKNVPDFRTGIKYYSNNGNLIFSFEPIVTNDKYGSHVLATDYVRSKLSGTVENAFIKLFNNNISLQFGRSSIFWGQSITSSIIRSGLVPSSENLLFVMKNDKTKFEMVTSQLGSEINNDGIRVKRFISGHKFSWIPNNRLLFGIGEHILYTGVNRTIELNYLNPIVPYVFYALEDEEEKREFSDNDNLIMFSYGRFKIKPNFSIYFEFIVDEYQIDKTEDENALGYKIGFDGRNNIFFNTSWFIELTKIDRLTYTHPGQFTSWENSGHSIGFPYGNDSECIQIQSMSNFRNGLILFCDFVYLNKRKNNLPVESDGDIYLDRNKNNYMFYEFSIIKKYKNFNLEAGWSHKPFPNTIFENKSIFPKKGSAFIKIDLLVANSFPI